MFFSPAAFFSAYFFTQVSKLFPAAVSRPVNSTRATSFGSEAAWKEVARELEVKHAELTAVSQRSQLVIESAPNGVLVVDHDGVITLTNAQAEKMFGLRREELPFRSYAPGAATNQRCPGGCHQPNSPMQPNWNFQFPTGQGVPVKGPRDLLALRIRQLVRHLGGDEAGRQRIDGDAELAHLARQRTRKTDQ